MNLWRALSGSLALQNKSTIMKNEERIVELLAETSIKFDQMIGKLEGGIVKLNLQTSENPRASIKLSNELERIANLNERVTKLEHAVYK